jgi:hypothetical protein
VDKFRHVGRSLQCPTDGRFDAQTTLAAAEEDNPNLVGEARLSGLADISALAALRPVDALGAGPLDQLAGFLPRMIRDHVPKNYFRALSITLP